MSMHYEGDIPRRGRPQNLMQLLLRLKERYPKDTKEQRKERFINAALDADESLAVEAFGFWFSLHDKTASEAPARPPRPTKSDEEKKVEAAETQKFITDTIAKYDARVLDIHVKMIKLMTGAEAIEFCKGDDMRAWFGRVGARVKPNDIIGKVLTDKQIRATK